MVSFLIKCVIMAISVLIGTMVASILIVIGIYAIIAIYVCSKRIFLMFKRLFKHNKI